jgi:hypothetical protein
MENFVLLNVVDPETAVRWVNEAIEKRAKKILVCYDGYGEHYFPHHLLDSEKEEEITNRVNSNPGDVVEGVLDVEAEVRSAYNSGEAGINYDKVWFTL